MAIVEDEQDVFRCYSYPIGTFAIGQDARGLVGTFVREYQLTVRQVVEQFAIQQDGRTIKWENVSSPVKTAWDAGNYEQAVPVTWLVKPNDDYDRTRLESKYAKWTSCHYETASSEEKFLRESGFHSFPLMVPRWDLTGEDSYGTDCPGMIALGDVKQLQIMQRRKGQLLAKAVDPPLVGPSSLRTQKTSLIGGDITYLDAREGQQGLKPIHEVRLEGFQHLTADMREVQYRIQRAFFEDLFLMLAQSDDRLGADRPTAREIDERHEEKLLSLGPTLERTNDELLDPVVDRVYAIMEANGLLPPPPVELDGVDLKVEYISILAQAQKLVGVVGLDRLLTSTVALSEQFPQVRHKININQAIDNYGEMLGTDPRVIRSNEEAESLQQQEAAAVQAQADAAQAKDIASAVKSASQAPVTGDTALSRIVQAGQAAPA
jgi:hypothetical protein